MSEMDFIDYETIIFWLVMVHYFSSTGKQALHDDVKAIGGNY